VFGFDNTPVAQAVGLSSVDQRLDEVAAGTFELLMGATGRVMLPYGEASGDDPRHRLITPQLVVRRSSHLEPVEEEAGGTTSGGHDRKEQQS
jgi:DNA-binding LacI/PurR family transcriptional regulator